jgi:hypothetical protein
LPQTIDANTAQQRALLQDAAKSNYIFDLDYDDKAIYR